MILKISSSDKNKIYNRTAIQLVASAVVSLTVFTVNAGEATKEADVKSETSTSPTKKPNNFLNRGAISGDPGILNNTGIIQPTDFSRETGLSGQSQSSEQVGFTKKIILTTGFAHDSNPALDDGFKRSVWIYSLTPQVLLDYTGELNNLYLDAALQVQRNSNEEVLADRDDPRLGLGWSRAYESGTYGVYANYSQFVSRAAEITATGVFGGNLDGESTQRNRAFGGRWQHAIAPRWSLLTTSEYVKTTFSGGVNLIGFGQTDIKSRLNYEYTEKLDTYLQLGYTKLKPDEIVEDTNLSRLALGANYQFSEGLTVSSRAGMYRSTGAQSDTDWEAGIQLAYEAGRMRYTAEMNRELVSSGLGVFQKTDTYRLGWFFNISEIDILRLNYSLVKFKGDELVLLPENEFQEAGVAYERILGGNWRGQANFSFREQNVIGSRSDGNLVGVTLIYDGINF